MRGENDDEQSSSSQVVFSRPYRSIVRHDDSNEQKHAYYTDFNDLKTRIETLNFLKDWKLEFFENGLTVSLSNDILIFPQYLISADYTLNYTIQIFNYLLPENHVIYKDYKRSLKNITISSLVDILTRCIICEGVANKEFHGKLIHHSIPLTLHPFKDNYDDNDDLPVTPFRCKLFCRTVDCIVLGIVKRCSS